MMGGAVKRCEAAAYDERQPAPPRGILDTIYYNVHTIVVVLMFKSNMSMSAN